MTDQIASFPLEKLRSPALSFMDLMDLLNKSEQKKPFEKEISFGLSSNVTCEGLVPFLKKQCLLHGMMGRVVPGTYDDHFNNLETFKKEKVDHVLVFLFLDNLLPNFEARLPEMAEVEVEALIERTEILIKFIFASTSSFKSTHISRFHSLSATRRGTSVAAVVDRLNQFLDNQINAEPTVSLMEPEALIWDIGAERAFDFRYYYKFKAPYSNLFWDRLAQVLFWKTRAFGSYFYKLIALDCDNTLWGGILGEDSIHSIKLDPNSYPGNIFNLIQHKVVKLFRNGVLIALCSKNNPEDVDEVIAKHPSHPIQTSMLVQKMVNWESKVINLEDLSKILNIGLDSFVFLDDSSFECEAVRSQLPMVKTFQVPKNITEYPSLLDRISGLFPTDSKTQSKAQEKTEQYRIRAQALAEERKFSSQEDYLRSLGIKVRIKHNPKEAVQRMAELTQKTNQFNLTTKRYSTSEMQALIEAPDWEVFSLEVMDRFGDSGLTGVLIIESRMDKLVLDSFLMSCRILGRGIEHCIWPTMIPWMIDTFGETMTIEASYQKTQKNSQVELFWESLGLELKAVTDNSRLYRSQLASLKLTKISHIEVEYAG